MTDADDLDLRWRVLPPPSGPLLEGERVADWAGGSILVAIDLDGRRHLLIATPISDERPSPIRPLQGLVTHIRRMRVRGEERTWIDLELTDARGASLFSHLCAELIEVLAVLSEPKVQAVSDVVDRWRRFWSTTREPMSTQAQLGLFGELWLLAEWLPAVTRSSIEAWRGPLGGRHDFVTPAVSVEVKVGGTASGPVTHHIQSLDQLDDASEGTLYLLSLHVLYDPIGPYTLSGLISDVRTAAESDDQETLVRLDERLGKSGWSPTDQSRYSSRLRVLSQELYKVEENFPRLTPESLATGIPAGVTGVSYLLDTSACSSWLVASSPAEDGPLGAIA
jgi:hypothetical protein